MFSIGEFARHGRVSVRMLRHEPEAITPVIQPLHRDLWQQLACAGD
jgi:hypothetical protein